MQAPPALLQVGRVDVSVQVDDATFLEPRLQQHQSAENVHTGLKPNGRKVAALRLQMHQLSVYNHPEVDRIWGILFYGCVRDDIPG